MTHAAPSPRKKAFRFRLYYRLVDAMLVAAAIGTADHVRERFGAVLWENSPAYLVVGTASLLVSFFVGPVVVAAKFMRDEYAESLWQRTNAVMAYAFALVPMAYVALFFGARLLGFEAFAERVYGLTGYATTGWLALLTAWMAYLLLFAGIFQFLRWKDSR